MQQLSKEFWLRIFLITLTIAIFCGVAFADDHPVTCSGNIGSALQTAITNSSDGDTVTIGNGSCTLNAGVTITDKNITIQGGGIGITNLTTSATGNMFDFIPVTKPFRITGFTVAINRNNDSFIRVRNSCNQSLSCTPVKMSGAWRVDHIRFNVGSGGNLYPGVQVTQDDPGVVDSCYFQNSGGDYLIGVRVCAGNGLYDATTRTGQWGEMARTRATGMGTADAIFMENNTVEMIGGTYCTINDGEGSSREVVRYNTFIGVDSGFQTHSTGNLGRGQVFIEIYNNAWTTSNSGNIGVIRSGTGVIYNNTVNGTPNMAVDDERSCSSPPAGANSIPGARCYGSGTWDGNLTDEQGWPCLDQIGMGSSASAGTYGNYDIHEPMYFWNNGGMIFANNSLCALSDTHVRSTAHSNDEVDYVVSGASKPGYTAYTCPHPTTGYTGSCDSDVAGIAGYNVASTTPAKVEGLTIRGGSFK